MWDSYSMHETLYSIYHHVFSKKLLERALDLLFDKWSEREDV